MTMADPLLGGDGDETTPGSDAPPVTDDAQATVPVRPPADGAYVVARNLTKKYGSFVAVDGIDLDIPRGSVFGLIGPNGAGKSTTFSMVASLLRPTSGEIRVDGHDPVRSHKEVRRRIGYMPDNIGVYGELTVGDYLRFFAASYRIPKRRWPDLIDGLLELVDLGDSVDTQVDAMSRGMKQRISLARTLVHDPELLILDEPASGLDPRARVELRELLMQLSAMGKTILISSHILAELEAVCTELAILDGGKVRVAGTPSEIRNRAGRGRRVRVQFADGTSSEFAIEDERDQSELLKHLVNEDSRDVLSFAPIADDLENLYLEVTESDEEQS